MFAFLVFNFKLYNEILIDDTLVSQVIGTFETIANTVKTTLTESLVQILSPRRRVDILRDAMEAKSQGRPFVMAFCGVNGVGKSTNLAKVRNCCGIGLVK